MLASLPWEKVLPVLVSIVLIIAIAVISEYSKTLAAITAVMPIGIPLGMWVAVAGQPQPDQFLRDFSALIALNMIPTLFFIAAAWWIARSGYGLWPTLIGGYLVWALALLILLGVRQLFGF
ncbi:MAG: hypothetical protein ACFE0Q_03355 [Anaerolineae bacterium]